MLLKKNHTETGLEVAVIGMAGRFPGARHIHEFWHNLKNGKESISFLSTEELNESGIDHEIINHPDFVKVKGGILKDKELFDASFFGYSPGEADVMSPQIKIFHEVAWEALEDSAYNPYAYDGLIGLFAGASFDFYWPARCELSGKNREIGYYAASQLFDKDYLSTRISFKLDLKGPSLSVQTACSTSLVAIHLACQSLLNGECHMALAGGVSIPSRNGNGYIYEEGMIRSPDGHCRAFDAKAKGTIGGSGIGIVVLKSLEDALVDRDYIYAVIKGTAVNNDGLIKAGFTAPAIKGQAEVIRTAQQVAEVEPESIGYVEAHGTGTALGDPIEIEALTLAFNTGKRHFCRIGSVKTNVGHLDAAAGVTGFIKTALSLKHQQIPPSLNFETPNPKIDFENSPFIVNTRLTEWKNDQYPLRAGVSSFGIGGTNAHVILEEAPIAQSAERKAHGTFGQGRGGVSPPGQSRQYQLILLSAKTQSALDKMTANLEEYFKNNPGINLADAAYTLQVGRKAFQHRKMVVCSDANEAAQALSFKDPGKVQTAAAREEKPSVVFMFPGQGSQYVNMGRELYEKESCFRQEMDRCFEILESLMDHKIKEIIYPGRGEVSSPAGESPATCNLHLSPDINQTNITQPLIFAFEYALAKLLMKWGIKPYAMIGHSIGEYVAAHLSGVFSLEEGLKLAVARGKLMHRMPTGSMISVHVPEDELIPFLNFDEKISLAAVNGPSLCVVSGPHQAIDSLEKQLEENGYESRRLHTSHAFHSQMMDPILEEFIDTLSQVKLNKPKIPYICGLTGKWLTPEEVITPGYWVRHLRETVRFSDGLNELFKKESVFFLEIGPGNTLCSFVKDHTHRKPGQLVINFIRHPREKGSDLRYFLSKIGQLWLYGKNIDWVEFYMEQPRNRIPLPPYPFAGQRYRIEPDLLKIGAEKLSQASVLRKKEDISNWFYAPSWKRFPLPLVQDDYDDDEIPGQENSQWLVFTDPTGLGARLVELLKRKEQTVISVSAGSKFTKVNDCEYKIDPHQTADYLALFEELLTRGKIPGTIVHMWNITAIENKGTGIEWVNQVQDMGFLSLVYQAQAIEKLKISHNIRMMVVSNNIHEVTGEEELCPGKATVLGAVKVIPQEYHNISCRSIDIDWPEPGTRDEIDLVRQLVREFSTGSPDHIIAFRSRFRWTRIYEQIPPTSLKQKKTLLKEKGVYMIIGGLGNIGLVLAQYLAKTVHARLVLTGRSDFPVRSQWDEWCQEKKNHRIGRKIRKLRELEELGAEVLVKRADAADEKQMQTVIAETEMKLGPLNGVIHAAGIIGDQVMRALDETDAAYSEQQFQSKVYGLMVLEKVLSGKKLDFCLLMSSLASVLGGLGFAAYSAANLFMDTFVLHHNRTGSGPWITVNWDGWKFETENRVNRTELAVNPQEGVMAFQYILTGANPDQVVVSVGDLKIRFEQWIERKPLQEEEATTSHPTPTEARPELSNAYAPPGNPLEKNLADIWQKFFGIEKIGVTDDFFQLGGDSLKATIMVSRIHKKFDVKIPLTIVFKTPFIKGLAEYIKSTDQDKYESIEPVEKKDYYPLSSAQKRMYFAHHLEKKSTSYNMPLVVRLTGEPGQGRLLDTAGKLIHRHESFRTSIIVLEDEPVQKVHEFDEKEFNIEFYDLGGSPLERGEPQEQDGVGEIIKNFIRPFELSQAPLLRIGLIKLEKKKHILMVDMYHIISDGYSFTVLINDFMALYNREALHPLRIQYKDFSRWQNRWFESEKKKKQEDYWLNRFKDDIPVLDIPTDYPRPPVQNIDEGEVINFALEKDLSKKLFNAVKETGTTIFILLLAVYNVLLYKYTGQEDIVVGSPITGRSHADLQDVIGVFLNMLAIRNRAQPDKAFRELLEEVKENALAAFENQEYPFDELVIKLGLQRDASGNPLFNTEFAILNIDTTQKEIPGLKLETDDSGIKFAKFDLHFLVVENKDTITITLRYSTALFKPLSIEKIKKFYIEILEQVIDNLAIKLDDITVSHDLLAAVSAIHKDTATDFVF